jgi:hypothetical protein
LTIERATQYERPLHAAEVILVPNGCRDDSEAVCARLAAAHPALRVVPSARAGWGLAVKTGLAAARGDLLCYTNSARTEPEELTLMLLYAIAYPRTVVKTNRKIREHWRRRVGSLLHNIECHRPEQLLCRQQGVGDALLSVHGRIAERPHLHPAAVLGLRSVGGAAPADADPHSAWPRRRVAAAGRTRYGARLRLRRRRRGRLSARRGDAAAPGAVYNVGSGVQTTLREVVAVARRVLAIAAEPSWGTMPPRSWDTSVWVADVRAIDAGIGWRPATAFAEGFARMAAWLRDPPVRALYERLSTAA